MRERKWGRIITTTSSGVVSPIPNLGLSERPAAVARRMVENPRPRSGEDGVSATSYCRAASQRAASVSRRSKRRNATAERSKMSWRKAPPHPAGTLRRTTRIRRRGRLSGKQTAAYITRSSSVSMAASSPSVWRRWALAANIIEAKGTFMDEQAIETLNGVSTATITTVLLKKGLRNVWMRGTKPLQPGQPRLAGPAFTLRFIPAREDLATPESWASPLSTRAAVEAMPQRMYRRGRCYGRPRRGHLWRHPLRAHGEARRRGPDHGRRRARCRRRPRNRSADLVRALPPLRRWRDSPSSPGSSRSRAAASRSFQTINRRGSRRRCYRSKSLAGRCSGCGCRAGKAGSMDGGRKDALGGSLPGLYPANAETKAR